MAVVEEKSPREELLSELMLDVLTPNSLEEDVVVIWLLSTSLDAGEANDEDDEIPVTTLVETSMLELLDCELLSVTDSNALLELENWLKDVVIVDLCALLMLDEVAGCRDVELGVGTDRDELLDIRL